VGTVQDRFLTGLVSLPTTDLANVKPTGVDCQVKLPLIERAEACNTI
jgi:hypothetical protein